MKNEEFIMLSIKMLAYNHEKYIVQAIESILTQKTEYSFELIIGEDCSTDNTRSIIKKYEEEYPDIIRVIYQKSNQGCTMNSYLLDLAARGKYIAGCEGDDFWCDETRIQRDVDFLEAHPEYVGVCHRCRVVDEDGREVDEATIEEKNKFWKFDSEIFKLSDYEKWLTPGHGCAQTRRNVIKENPDIDYSIIYKASKRVGDRTHLLIHVIEGDIYCMQDVVACYRYRVSGNQQNFMALQKKRNLRDEDYLMIKRLEEWAKESRGIELNLDKIKKDRLIGATSIWLKDCNSENKKVVENIIRYSGEGLKYRFYVIKIICIKMFCWKILKKDKLIRL